ncbi:ArsR/SmtB family transcription factor [Raoultibacter phocaeensis]|uniref:ArsR/SmtB family transcription factor n=1 Tax=Raoultibacter phocaeensis TaxID=2479841 RepID=UPI0015D6478F|nr:metalloregulator ArsR/SmtB family transcription factor [Raoultibacter phocaeensis]
MKYLLHPAIETLSLLTVSHWGKQQKKKAIKALDDFGINGTAFYAANYPLLEKFFADFDSRRVETEGTAFIENMADELALSLIPLIIKNPNWLDGFNDISEEEVRIAVDDLFSDLLESDGSVVDALQTSGFPDKAKWQIAALLQQPKQRLMLVIDAINANLPAFDYAYAKHEAEIRPLLELLEDCVSKNELPDVVSQVLASNPNTIIVPSLAAALAVILYDTFCVFGLLVTRVFAGQNEGYGKTEAILAAKALSDANRLEILEALKTEELYNLEIARMLDLTPATTSHHMNALLSAAFVECSLKDGKAYYRLCPEGIKRYRDWVEKSFL